MGCMFERIARVYVQPVGRSATTAAKRPPLAASSSDISAWASCPIAPSGITRTRTSGASSSVCTSSSHARLSRSEPARWAVTSARQPAARATAAMASSLPSW